MTGKTVVDRCELDLPWGDWSDAFWMKVINHFRFACLSQRNKITIMICFLFHSKIYLSIEISMQFSAVCLHIELANAVTMRCWFCIGNH